MIVRTYIKKLLATIKLRSLLGRTKFLNFNPQIVDLTYFENFICRHIFVDFNRVEQPLEERDYLTESMSKVLESPMITTLSDISRSGMI